jgi:hypothetical protein
MNIKIYKCVKIHVHTHKTLIVLEGKAANKSIPLFLRTKSNGSSKILKIIYTHIYLYMLVVSK